MVNLFCSLLCRQTYDTNFENLHNGLITLFIVTTQENWPTIMF